MKRKDVTFFGMSGEEHEVRCATAAQARKQLSRIYAMPCEAVLILTRESHAPVSDGDQELFNSTTCFSVVVDAEKMLLHFLNFFRGTSWPFRSMQQLEEHRGFLRIQKQKEAMGKLPSGLTTINAGIILFDKNAFGQLPSLWKECSFPFLRSIEASCNKICNLPEDFGKLAKLTFLNLADNAFKEFPEVLVRLTKLKHVDLSNNCIKVLPSSVEKLVALNSLALDNMSLEVFPSVVFPKLRYLSLKDNKLVDLPASLGESFEMHTAKLHNNRFKFFPDCISCWRNLRRLFIPHNPMSQKIPDWLGCLKYLEELQAQPLRNRNEYLVPAADGSDAEID